MDREHQGGAAPAKPQSQPETSAKPGEDGITTDLGREKPGEGLDTGVDTRQIQPGQNGANRID